MDNRRRFIAFLVSVLFVLATLQNAMTAILPPGLAVEYYDDVAVLIAISAALPSMSTSRGIPVLALALWASLMMLALLRSTVPVEQSLLLFRQVTMPFVLLAIGLVWGRRFVRLISRSIVIVGTVNLIYMVPELLGWRLIDPLRLMENRGWQLAYVGDTLPAYYYYYPSSGGWLESLGGPEIVRLGGLFLNPPVAGMATACAAVVMWRGVGFKSYPYRALMIALVVATVLTFSRGGWAILTAGIALPLAMRTVGTIGILVSTPVVMWAISILAQGSVGGQMHLDGFTAGVVDALESPLGRGFGEAGNILTASGMEATGESLLGVAFSAAGLPAVAIVLWLAVALLAALRQDPGDWRAAVGLGLVFAAALSETAGAVYGTLGLWLAVGATMGSRGGVSMPRANPRLFASECWVGPRPSVQGVVG